MNSETYYLKIFSLQNVLEFFTSFWIDKNRNLPYYRKENHKQIVKQMELKIQILAKSLMSN